MSRNELERELRELRRTVFDGTTAQQAATSARIIAIKVKLAPFWKSDEGRRSDNSAMRAIHGY